MLDFSNFVVHYFLIFVGERIKGLLPYFYVLIGFFAILIISIIVLDKIVFPLLIHSGDTVKMPNLIGMKISDAENLLKSLDLKLARVNELFSANYPPGTVINQSPRAGQVIKKGREVFITISQGREEVVVPNLIGKHIRDSRIILKNIGLDIGNLSYVNSENFGVDSIVAQSPQYGTKVPYGTQIDVVVSRGSVNLVKVPYLEGLNLDAASKLLFESELEVGELSYVESQTYLPNTVLQQSLKAGSLVPKGTKIALTIVK
ncbi:MAG: PASTA domain-containing protein [Ignavibacteria bacterium]|nr:PASTA domain-containing protein [Ignavibacteria bacterium]